MTSQSLLHEWFPQATFPFLCNAPMYGTANAELATAVTKAGGFGFIGGGLDFSPHSRTMPALDSELARARALLALPAGATLPLGVGFLTFKPANFLDAVAPALAAHRPAAVWLFAPAERGHHARVIPALKAAGEPWGLRVFVMVGTVQAAREAVADGADVLVAQGTDAGGHQWARGASVVSLVPEIVDMLAAERVGREVPVVAAGGIVDGRGVAAALALGAQGVVMGTRFVVTIESPTPDAVKALMVSTTDGGASTIKSTVHDDIQGTGFWPAAYDGRAIIGPSYRDFTTGLSTEENVEKYKAAVAARDQSRLTAWSGTGIGLIKEVLSAGEVVVRSQEEAKKIMQSLSKL